MDSLLSLFTIKFLKDSSTVPSDYSLTSIIKFLKIPPSQRQIREISILKMLTSKVFFFTSQPPEILDSIHYQCCQSMRYEHLAANEVVFKYGETGKKFYIILNGSTQVSIPLPGSDKLGYINVAVLKAGHSFGDLALLKDQPRNATITCLTDCHFAVLAKEDYLRIVGKIADRKIVAFVDLLKEIPIFRPWSKKNLENLYYFFKPVSYLRNSVVFTQGSEAAYAYIVKSGEFEISKKVNFSEKKVKMEVKVALLTKGELFGDDDVLEDCLRKYKCTCYSSTGELLVISARDFLLKIKSDESIGLINNKNKAKNDIRGNREKALEDHFSPKKTVKVTSPKPDLTFKLAKKYFPSLIKEKHGQNRSEYLELSASDIKNIKARALPTKSGRMFIAMNIPADFSYRTPSPSLRSKTTALTSCKQQRMNRFSSIDKSS